MDPSILVIGMATIVFGVLPIILRSSAVLIFLTLSAGELLSRLTAQDATQMVRSLPATNGLPTYSIVQIVLLTVVPLVILMAYKNSIKPFQLFFQFLPAIASVLICIMLVTAKLPYELKGTVEASGLYKSVEPFFSVALAAGLLSSAFYLVATKPRLHKDKKRHM